MMKSWLKFFKRLGIGALILLFAACGGGGGSNSSDPAELNPPDGVIALDGNQQIGIAWNPVSNATSYNLYWSRSSGVTKGSGTKIADVASPYYHAGLTNQSRYYYIVTAANAKGESAASIEVSGTPRPDTPPPAPAAISVKTAETEVTLFWSPVAEAAATVTYNIYWSQLPGVKKTNATQIVNATNPYVHTGLKTGSSYYYVVTSVNAYGESLESREVMATPKPVPIPEPPTELTAAVINNQIKITWKPVEGADSYNLYWSNSADVSKKTGTKISTASSPYIHSGVTKGQTYYYVITAVNSYGESAESKVVSARVDISVVDIIVATGDSITVGYALASYSDCYVPKLAAALSKPSVNEGIDGGKSSDGAHSIDDVLSKHNPRYLTIYYGNNDAGFYSTDSVIGNLQYMVERCLQNGTTPVVATLGPQFDEWAWRQPYIIDINQNIRKLAQQYGIALADLEVALNWKKQYMADGIHPNATGHTIIANTFYGVMK